MFKKLSRTLNFGLLISLAMVSTSHAASSGWDSPSKPSNGLCWSDPEAHKVIDANSGWIAMSFTSMFSYMPSFQPSVCPQINFKNYAVCSISTAKTYYISLANKYKCLTPDDPSWNLTPISGHVAFEIGDKYYYGRGVSVDYRKASAWYVQAGDFPGALVALGYMYYNGLGRPIDYGKARDFYEKAAARGNGSAMFDLGIMSQLGRAGPLDLSKARYWYEKALSRAKQTGDARLERDVRNNLDSLFPRRTNSNGSGGGYNSSSSYSNDDYNSQRQQYDLQTEMIQQDHQQQDPQ